MTKQAMIKIILIINRIFLISNKGKKNENYNLNCLFKIIFSLITIVEYLGYSVISKKFNLEK